MGTVADKLNKIIDTKANIKNAIITKGVSVSDADTFASYAEKILSISGGGDTPDEPYTPNADMVWLKNLCDSKTKDGYQYKQIIMIPNITDKTNITVPSSCVVETSDGKEYTSTSQHTWDDTSARDGEYYTGMKLRWILLYSNIKSNKLTILPETLYIYSDGCDIDLTKIKTSLLIEYFEYSSNTTVPKVSGYSSNLFGQCSLLKSIPFINTSEATSLYGMFQECYNLLNIPKIDTSKVKNVNYMFNKCYLIRSIPELDFSSVTTCSETFSYCQSITEIPNIDISKSTNTSYMFRDCRSLSKIPTLDLSSCLDARHMFSSTMVEELNLINVNNIPKTSSMFYFCIRLKRINGFTPSGEIDCSYMFNQCQNLEEIRTIDFSTNNLENCFYNNFSLKSITFSDTSKCTNFQSTFSYCKGLVSIYGLDFTSATTANSMFQYCNSLVNVQIDNITQNLDLSASKYISKESMIYLFNQLVDLTGQSAKTIKFNTSNIYKPTDEEKAIATAKNWTVVI